MKEKNIEAAKTVRSTANKMDVLLIALESIVKSMDDTAEYISGNDGDTNGLFAYTRELSTLHLFLLKELEDLEDLADKLEKARKA